MTNRFISTHHYIGYHPKYLNSVLYMLKKRQHIHLLIIKLGSLSIHFTYYGRYATEEEIDGSCQIYAENAIKGSEVIEDFNQIRLGEQGAK